MKLEFLNAGLRASALSEMDLQFAHFLAEHARQHTEEVALAAALVSRASGGGHVCLDLKAIAGAPLWEGVHAPALDAWRAALQASGVLKQDDRPAPLVLEGERLYLYRYWRYEVEVAEKLRALAQGPEDAPNEEGLRVALRRWFPSSADSAEPDWQQLAAALAVLKRFAVISGGPGTGKTTTVLRVLAILAELSPRPLRIALAAPTGKAAARLQESLRLGREALQLPPAIAAQLPKEAATLHRLLGHLPGRTRFRHRRDHPLALDVLVIDEASMIDLALMAKLLDALPPDARLIMLGDKDQLASVEAGAVMNSLCADAQGYSFALAQRLESVSGYRPPVVAAMSALSDNIAVLRRAYRFEADSGIGALAQAALAGDAERSLALLGRETTQWRSSDGALQDFIAAYSPLLQAAQSGAAPQVLMQSTRRFAVLCAHREGPMGARRLNEAIEQGLRRTGLIATSGDWYPGRLVMMNRNDYGLRLFNGEVGIACKDETGGLAVYFPAADGSLIRYATARVAGCETAFAMTVHKAQGSEFESAAFVLPAEASPILSRELFYTAVTRASRRLSIYGGEAAIRAALARRVERDSALAQRLR